MAIFNRKPKVNTKGKQHLPMKANYDPPDEDNYSGEYEALYAEVDNYDPPSIYDYVDIYEAAELDPQEVQEKVDYVVQDAGSTEEAVAELYEAAEKAYQQAMYLFEEVVEKCNAKIEELGYRPPAEVTSYTYSYGGDYEDPAVNMDTEDLLEGVRGEDEEDLVDELAKGAKDINPNVNRRKRNNRRSVQPKINRTITEYEKAIKKMGANFSDVSKNMEFLTKTIDGWHDDTVQKLRANGCKMNIKTLQAMESRDLEDLATSLGVEVESPATYILNNMQVKPNSSQDQGVHLSVNAFEPRKKEAR